MYPEQQEVLFGKGMTVSSGSKSDQSSHSRVCFAISSSFSSSSLVCFLASSLHRFNTVKIHILHSDKGITFRLTRANIQRASSLLSLHSHTHLEDQTPTVFCYPENKPMRPLVRNMLQRHGDYEQIEYNHTTGGLMALQQGHNLDRGKGWYETTAAHVGYENGHAVILTLEDHSKLYVKNTDGTWDGQVMEIAAVETGTANNIRNAQKHCACKPNTEVAVLIFPNDNFNTKELTHGMAKYYGLRQTEQYKPFHSIYCIQAKQGTIQKFKPAPVTDTETQA